jgi:hypothetical protein
MIFAISLSKKHIAGSIQKLPQHRLSLSRRIIGIAEIMASGKQTFLTPYIISVLLRAILLSRTCKTSSVAQQDSGRKDVLR